MKRKSLLWLSALLLMLTGCSSDDGDIFPKECKYTSTNIRPSKDDEVVSNQGSWTITTYANMIMKAEFNSESPSSAELFFKDNLPLTTDNALMFRHSLKNAQTNYIEYAQLYKGMEVYRCGYICNYDQNDVLKNIEGAFVPIDNLDINPKISQDNAKHIIANYLHLDNTDISVQLQITPFYYKGKIDVRLTYRYDNWYGCWAHYECFVDAHSGEMLCSDFPSNENKDVYQIVGEWMASHHSKNPNSADTADMWDFSFNADGTGSWPLATRSFKYKIEGNRITLQLMNTEAYYGQTKFIFDIVSHSADRMEWDEIPNENWGNYGLYLMFYRKDK